MERKTVDGKPFEFDFTECPGDSMISYISNLPNYESGNITFEKFKSKKV